LVALAPSCKVCREVRPLRVGAGLCLSRLQKGNRSNEKRKERQQRLCDMVVVLFEPAVWYLRCCVPSCRLVPGGMGKALPLPRVQRRLKQRRP
jgi:hypothetical protein